MVTQKAKREIESGKRTEEQSKKEKLKKVALETQDNI